ncbi:glycosyltransferase family 9 protein [Ramlibacter sp. MMS24-I3-19]|uniref:glycosyltransferase family 9 protein n=1 Tax=Ramlibacter sp. MMS24-I3-19 TaxID=3416606 RepID=UPI003CFE2AF3
MTTKRTFELGGLEYLRTHSRAPGLGYAVAVADQLGRVLFGRTHPSPPPRLEGRTLVIAKIDHLGDLLMITPLLVQLRAQAPTTRLVLLIGGWSVPLAQLLQELGLCDGHVVRSPWALHLGATVGRRILEDIRTAREAAGQLAGLAPAALVDLRPFTPNSLLLAHQLKVPYRVGFALRGLSYTLHASLRYDEDQPLGQLFLNALPALGLRPANYDGPTLGPFAPRVAEVPSPAGMPSQPIVVVQAASRTAAKNAPLAAWKALLPVLARTHVLVFVGSRSDAKVIAPLLAMVPPDCRCDLTGRTTVAQLFKVCGAGEMVLSVDSLAAHIGQAMNRPTLVLTDTARTPSSCYPHGRPGLHLVSKDAPPVTLLAALAPLLGPARCAGTRLRTDRCASFPSKALDPAGE